jgi:hypothetical protein
MVLDTVENTYKLQKRKKYFFHPPCKHKKGSTMHCSNQNPEKTIAHKFGETLLPVP